MNQLLIALLISTSLTGVIQGGFISSLKNDNIQDINQQPIEEVSQVAKDELADFLFIDQPVKKTSSTIVQNEQQELENRANSSTNTSIQDLQMSIRTSTIAATDDIDKAEEDDVKSNKSRTGLSKVEKAEKKMNTQENKVIETPAGKDNDEVKEIPVKVEKEENNNTETALSSEVEEVEAEHNQSTENSNEDENIITVKATAYTADCEGGTGVTYTGIDLKANPNQKVIAVDPSVIPLGTKVYVEGYGNAIAGDIGGAIKGNKIDVFIPSETEAEDWGIKTVDVKILED